MPCAADRAWHADGLGSGRGREGEGLLTPLRIRSRALPHRTHAVDHRPGAREGQHRQAHPQRVSRSRVRVVSAQDKQTSAGTVELKPIVAAGQSSCRNALRFGCESASKTAQPRRKPSTAAACAVHVSVCGTKRVQHVAHVDSAVCPVLYVLYDTCASCTLERVDEHIGERVACEVVGLGHLARKHNPLAADAVRRRRAPQIHRRVVAAVEQPQHAPLHLNERKASDRSTAHSSECAGAVAVRCSAPSPAIGSSSKRRRSPRRSWRCG